jgi:hypothetical protein
VLAPLVLVLPLTYVMDRRTLGPTAGTRRFLAVLPIMIGLMVLGILLAWVLFRSGIMTGFVGLQYGFVLAIGVLVGYMLYRTRQAGALLVDLGPPRPQRFLRIIGMLQLVRAGMGAVLALVDRNFTSDDLAHRLSGSDGQLVHVPRNAAHATARTRAGGGDLLRWHNITGYQWETDRPNTLTLQVNTKMAIVRRPCLPILPEHHDAVDRILAQYVGHEARA